MADREMPDGDPFWTAVVVGENDPTTGGISWEHPPCLFWWPDETSPYGGWRCTRERHNDGIHVATTEIVRAIWRRP
jgi:hypothetical protein